MILSSINVAANYPNEQIHVYLNPLDAPLENARVGVRFRSFYYDTRDQRINFNNTASYQLSSIESDPSITPSVAIQPTNFMNPMDLTPFKWTVANPNEYVYVSFLGGTSGLTLWPSHPYPKLNKVDNFRMTLSAGLVAASAFDGEVQTPDYRMMLKDANFGSVNFNSGSLTLAGENYRYISAGRKGFELGPNMNFLKTYSRKSLGANVIANSFTVEVPVVTSKVVLNDDENQIFRLTFMDNTNSNGLINDASKATNSNLQCLSSEALSAIGIAYPYTTNATLNNRTGALNITFNNLFVNHGDDIIASYETSAAIPATFTSSVTSLHTGTNKYTLSSGNLPVYFWNYRFLTATPSRRDAFTVSFQPSSYFVTEGYDYADVATVMRDNYYQNTFPIQLSDGANSSRMLKRFIETTDDYSLSAILMTTPNSASNVTYRNREWCPAYADFRFINNGLGNRHTVRLQLSSFTGAIYEDENPIEFLLNKRNIVLNLGITESGESSATASTIIFPSPSEGYNFKWEIDPPENVTIRDLSGNLLSAGEFYPDFEAQFFNLGVDKTKITIYSEEYETSATTYWFPPSSVVNDMTLEVFGEFDDNNQTATGTLSAFCNRKGFSYRVPENASIIWNETANDSRGTITFTTLDGINDIQEGTTYASDNNHSLINASISSIPTPEYPNSILFNINCGLFRNDFALNASKLFLIREYPSLRYLNIDAITATGTQVIPSSVYSHKVLNGTATINMSAVYPDLSVSATNLLWEAINSDNVTVSGQGETFSLNFSSVSACVTLSALSATPYGGNFKKYNFTDSICFFNLSSQQPFNYIAFPENQYNPLRTAASTYSSVGICGGDSDTVFNIYAQSQGMSSYKPCHTENFYFSASPGFDRYVWNVGDINVETESNKTVIPVAYANVSATNTVHVSAYNFIFREDDPITIYNSASSNGSNKYKQPITFLEFPSPTATIGVTEDYFNVNVYGETPRMTCEIDTAHLNLKNYTMNIVLSGTDGLQTKAITHNRQVFNNLIEVGIEDADFIINENSFNIFNLYVSGNVGVTIDGYDFCTEYKPVTSNIISLSAYNGPNLELYATKNIVSAGEVVTFYNGSNTNFFTSPLTQFVAFEFDNGEGTIQSTTSAYIATTYASEGSKTPSLTGLLSNGASAIQTWDNMIFVKDEFEEYDDSITREFYEEIEMPYSLKDIKVKPNDWQYASVLNDSFEKIQTNFEFLSASCSVNNITFPKAYGGYLGTRYGNFKWQTKYTTSNVQEDQFEDVKSVQWVGSKIIITNDDRVEIYTATENPELIYSTNRIGDGEILSNPVKAHYVSELNRLYILDKGKSIMFVCEFDIDNPSGIKLTHYWGGFGGRLDRTRLNNPVDFHIDSDNHLYIVDKDSYAVKIYNKNLNWIRNIVLSSWNDTNRPVCISEKDRLFAVTTEHGTTDFMDEFGNVSDSIYVEGSTGSSLNAIHEGIIYIFVDNLLRKYTTNGTFVAEEEYTDTIRNVVYDADHGYVVFDKHILKFVDFIQIDKIINENESLSGFAWDSIYIGEHEFVTDYIYNDSFKKIHDNIVLLNSRLDYKLHVDVDEYGDVVSQYTSSYTPSAITEHPIYIGTNEPVLYDTINRGIEFIYNNLEELRDNTNIRFVFPNNNSNIQWRWKFHYIDQIQKPSLQKNPVSWRELKSSKIIGNTQLSAYSAWFLTREGNGGNHCEFCFNYQQTSEDYLFPLEWATTESGNVSGHVFTWSELESDCCRHPDTVFADCVSAC